MTEPVQATTPEQPARPDLRLHGVLFVLTVVSVFKMGAGWNSPNPTASWYELLLSGWTFAVPLMLILVCHEAGHYVASRIHRVPASLPYFIPFPVLNPFGTMGAVILMRGRIRSARALLDIGAAGPLAGMVVAIPTMILGLRLSEVLPKVSTGYFQEGQSLLYMALKYVALGPIPSTHDVHLHPTAFAAWAGFFVTFLNLLPFAQLDGGHVAYALFGKRHNKWSRRMWLMPLGVFVYNVVTVARPVLAKLWLVGYTATPGEELHTAVSATASWVLLTILVWGIAHFFDAEHPPVDEEGLGFGRRVVAWFTLILFILLFMPAPLVLY